MLFGSKSMAEWDIFGTTRKDVQSGGLAGTARRHKELLSEQLANSKRRRQFVSGFSVCFIKRRAWWQWKPGKRCSAEAYTGNMRIALMSHIRHRTVCRIIAKRAEPLWAQICDIDTDFGSDTFHILRKLKELFEVDRTLSQIRYLKIRSPNKQIKEILKCFIVLPHARGELTLNAAKLILRVF
jgi:hypothetical protein